MLDLKANPNRPGVGTVIESSLDKGKGYVAKLLVQNGTLKIGDPILAGSCYGKVKALFNERNQPVKSVGPASPVLLLGLDGAPQAGDTFKPPYVFLVARHFRQVYLHGYGVIVIH